jgi:hypothetical protein
MIDEKMAWRLRSERGLMLPTEEKKYTNPRLAQIARLQAHFLERFKALDDELKAMAEK